jgi:CCR4-NOT transcription complex subunit 6
VVACSTHITNAHQTPAKQLAQTQVLLSALAQYVERASTDYPDSRINVLIGGDFNSTPGSGVHELVCNGSLELNHADAVVTSVQFPFARLQHSLQLHNAYADALPNDSSLTNYTHEFVGALDHIFYQREHMLLSSVLLLPSRDDCTRETGLPNTQHGSDHVAIAAQFKFR